MRLRGRREAEDFSTGLDLVEPRIVQVHKWRPDGTGTEVIRDEDVAMYGAVARKSPRGRVGYCLQTRRSGLPPGVHHDVAATTHTAWLHT